MKFQETSLNYFVRFEEKARRMNDDFQLALTAHKLKTYDVYFIHIFKLKLFSESFNCEKRFGSFSFLFKNYKFVLRDLWNDSELMNFL